MKLKTILQARKCEVCGNEFVPKTLTSLYCSIKCTKEAYNIRRKKEKEEKKFKEAIGAIPDGKEYLTVEEACTLFSVSKKTIYRLIRGGVIPSVNLGTRMTRVKRSNIEERFCKRESIETPTPKKKRLYSLEPEDCYTIGEIEKKFNISNKTVYLQIRQNSIPTRQIGKFVYAPKQDIDELFK